MIAGPMSTRPDAQPAVAVRSAGRSLPGAMPEVTAGDALRPSPGRAAQSERSLVRDAQRGSEEAVEALFRLHWPRAHRAAYVIVRDSAAAEDIAQEAFLSALRSLHRFDRRRPLGPWLHRIVVNRAIDWTRRRALQRESPAGERLLDSRERFEPPVRDPVEAGEERDRLDVALRDLSPEQRAVVVLRHLLEYTPGEIARMLDLPRGTVNSRLRRGLDGLRGILEADASEDER